MAKVQCNSAEVHPHSWRDYGAEGLCTPCTFSKLRALTQGVAGCQFYDGFNVAENIQIMSCNSTCLSQNRL